MAAKDTLARVLSSNRTWAASKTKTNPNNFIESAKGQTPPILWIGCADSRIPETTILGLEPGQVFVHRNIANILTDNDLSSLSVIEYAVKHVKVECAIVCGHTGCAGVNAALGNAPLGIIDPWLQTLRRLRLAHATELARLNDDGERCKRLSELNVLHSLDVLKRNPTVIEAVKQRNFQVHGVLYDLASGQLSRVEDDEPASAAEARTSVFDTSVS